MEKVEAQMSELRVSKQIERDAQRILESEGISAPIPIISEKCGVGKPGDVPLSTNVYGVMMTQQIPVYRYDVSITTNLRKKDNKSEEPKVLYLTKKVKGDPIVVDRRNRCRDVYIIFQKVYAAFLKDPKCVYFDLQSILYSLNQLEVPDDRGVSFNIPASLLGKDWIAFDGCDITIRKVTENFQLSLGDFSNISRDLTQMEHSLSQFLDIATSQQLFLSKEHVTFSANSSYLMDHVKHGFRADDVCAFQDNGAYLAIGTQKSIKVVEGPPSVRGRNTALVVQTKKTPFHMVENLINKASRFVRDLEGMRSSDIEKLGKTFSGLYVETKHLGHASRYLMKGLDNENAEQKMILIEGNQMTVKDYFAQKYSITLKRPRVPLVLSRGKDGNLIYIPMELCFVSDNQRVKTNQQTQKQIQESIKKCAIPPGILSHQNHQLYKSLNLTNDFINNAQLKISPLPLMLGARLEPPPNLDFANGSEKVRTDNFTWKGKKYLIPAGCKKWAALAMLGRQERLQENEFNNFLQRFEKEASSCGMRFPRVSGVKILSPDQAALRGEIQQIAKAGIDFVLVIHPDSADELHGCLKLCEREFSIITQAIRFTTLMNMVTKGQPMTLQNIVNKTNIKLGGLNYSLSLDSQSARETLQTDTLYVGFGMNHPGGGLGSANDDIDLAQSSHKIAAPSIIGYSANVGLAHEFEFVGDFMCQEPLRSEKVNVIQTIFDRCLDKYRENRKKNPRRIILYRDGCGEGQFPMILQYEVPLIKLVLEKKKCSAPLTLIVSNKLQNIRFFPKDIDTKARPADQNIKPGTVIDHSVVHPEYNEFFVNSHRALQGTARTPKYTVLVNEGKIDVQQLEKITYQLCYGHQIVYMPTSLPSPVYIAIRYAERGRKMYTRWIKCPTSDHSNINYVEMTHRLGYYGNKALENRRVNA